MAEVQTAEARLRGSVTSPSKPPAAAAPVVSVGGDEKKNACTGANSDDRATTLAFRVFHNDFRSVGVWRALELPQQQLVVELSVRCRQAGSRFPASLSPTSPPAMLVAALLPLLPPAEASKDEQTGLFVYDAAVHWGPGSPKGDKVAPPPVQLAGMSGGGGAGGGGAGGGGPCGAPMQQLCGVKRCRLADTGGSNANTPFRYDGLEPGLNERGALATSDPLVFPNAAAAAAAAVARPPPRFTRDYSGLQVGARQIPRPGAMYTDPRSSKHTTVHHPAGRVPPLIILADLFVVVSGLIACGPHFLFGCPSGLHPVNLDVR